MIVQHGRGGAERGEEHDPANCLPLHLKHKQGEINTENAIQNTNKGGIKHYQGDIKHKQGDIKHKQKQPKKTIKLTSITSGRTLFDFMSSSKNKKIKTLFVKTNS